MADSDPAPQPTRWQQTFAALQHQNYRFWFWGQLVSLFGTWMQATAQGFLVYELTHSARYLGFVGFAAGVPMWALTLYGGVAADRFSRRSLMVVTQTVMMTLAFILAALTFLHVVQPWHIILLALLLGTANAFDAPARQALASELVPREDLTNAIALNSTMFNTATAIGPAVAGVAYAVFGPGWCFTINGLSFIAVIIALRLMKLEHRPAARREGGSFAQLTEGIRYVLREPVIRTTIGVVAVTSLFALSMATLVPAWAVEVLHGDATVNGLLLSARGVGSLVGALLLASLGRMAARGRLLTVGSLVYPTLLFVFALVTWLPASLVVLAGVGVGTILVLNLANAIVQTSTPDDLRGRVMGAYTWIFFGCMPIGALWTGLTAEHLGEPVALVINAGLAMLFALAALLFFPRLRRE
ncbi:MAG TPA: MFS transporter [Vicinamibacterales bacterium]|jgi:MFS family permease